MTIQIVAGNVAASVWDVGPDIPVVEANALAVLIDLALIAGVWRVLLQEGVEVAEIGLSTTLVAPAIGAVAVFYVALNVVGIGLGVLVAGSSVVGYQWPLPPIRAVAWFVYVLAVAGIVEELVFRGYIQSKVIALVGGDTRLGIGIGIVVQSALFTASHAPKVLTSGVPGTEAVTGLGGILYLSGLGYGILYELTQNLYIPILVHVAGNMLGAIGIVFFDTGAFPPWAGVAYPRMYLALFSVVLVGYRRCAFDAGRMPVRSARRDSTETAPN